VNISIVSIMMESEQVHTEPLLLPIDRNPLLGENAIQLVNVVDVYELEATPMKIAQTL
jgi:hypothetical protein